MPTDAARQSVAVAGLDTADVAFAAAFAVLAVWSWVGICLAEAGLFEPAWLAGLAGPASAVAAAAVWRALIAGPRARTSLPAVVALVGVAALASWLAARPGEYLVDGSDGSVYLNIGRAVARHHGLPYPEPLLALLPVDQWQAVLSRELVPPRIFNLFPGGIQVYPGNTTVWPNFFHLFPVWVAIADVTGGATAAYYVSPAFGVVAIVAFWLLARAFTSPLAATLASVLLLTNFAQIWFTRLPTTEIMTQAFALSGLYFTTCCYRRPSTVLGVVGALAFGLAAFIRIDVLMLVLPTVAVFLVLMAVERRWHRAWTWFAVVLVGLAAHAIGHAMLASGPYTERIVYHALRGRSVSSASRTQPILVLVSGALALLVSRWPEIPRLASRLAWLTFVGVLASAVARILPELRDGFLLLLMSPAGAAMALVAIAVWLVGDRSAPAALVVGVLLASTIVYGESVRDRADLPMALRRFVPIVLPLAALVIGVLIDRLWRQGPAGRVAALAGWAMLAISWGAASRPIVAAEPMRGLHDQFARIAASLPENAIVITDASTPSHFALSLHTSFRRDVLFVSWTANTAHALESLARHTARPLLVAQGDTPGQGSLSARDVVGLNLAPLGQEFLQSTQLATSPSRLPSAFIDRTTAIQFYVARPRTSQKAPVTVEIGAADLSARVDGFHDAEQMGNASTRWTRDMALVQLPQMETASRGTLVLRLAAPRAASVAPPRMRVSLDGVEVGTTPALGPSFQLVELPLPGWSLTRLSAGPTVLTLAVPTFVPAEHGMGADTRQLGAVVDWVRVDSR